MTLDEWSCSAPLQCRRVTPDMSTAFWHAAACSSTQTEVFKTKVKVTLTVVGRQISEHLALSVVYF
eukprot:5826973-Amphidinium_carterae.1